MPSGKEIRMAMIAAARANSRVAGTRWAILAEIDEAEAMAAKLVGLRVFRDGEVIAPFQGSTDPGDRLATPDHGMKTLHDGFSV